jgi:hypothetical protein
MTIQLRGVSHSFQVTHVMLLNGPVSWHALIDLRFAAGFHFFRYAFFLGRSDPSTLLTYP